MSVNWWVENKMCLYNGKLFNNKRRSWYTLQHEHQNHRAKWKNPDTEDHILHDSIYMKRPEKAALYVE